MPMSSTKATLRLSENMDSHGRITEAGARRLIDTVAEFASIAETSRCVELMPFATSALREATNSEQVLARVRRESGVDLEVLAGVDEARLTFLAVRRWYGWSAGRILNLDIGGGSLEMTNGADEAPDVAVSLQLGAGRLTREWLREDPPGKRRIAVLRDWLDAELVTPAKQLIEPGKPDLAVGTSKTFRSLARLTGAAPSAAGTRVRRTLTSSGLRQLIAFISRMTAADRAELEGVSSDRSQQLVAGALVAEASMRALSLDTLEICPWALREGLILRKLDTDMNGGPTAKCTPGPAADDRQEPGGGAPLSGPIGVVPS
ncbi:Ppx/GppA family phosphatase [Nocardia panacis]|uniref:Ppx/GppA family phosphatase n=2 Tax=Nocardia panacis TaxID=2340916 RepID=A0A3A4KEP4_9NOCA|nr:Ppx/GppA family phosphatase [Nocardia panacis]